MNKKLEIGTPNARFDGWDTLAFSDNGVTGFNIITEDLPYKDDSLNEIYWSHVIEHIPYCHIKSIVTGIYNKLEVGGKFRTVCPDMKKMIEAYVNNDISQFSSENNYWGDFCHKDIYPQLGIGGMLMALIIGSELAESTTMVWETSLTSRGGVMYGVVSHVAGWDYDMLKNLLNMVGFSKVEQTGIESVDMHQRPGQLCVNAYK